MIQTAQASRSTGAHGQDRAALIDFGEVTVVVVADGAGGTGGGAAAAELVVAHVRRVAEANALPDTFTWRATFAELDMDLRGVGQTTAVVVVLSEGKVTGCSVGDSGAWLITSLGFIDLTERQKRKPLLGTGNAEPVAFSRPWADGTLLVATDGLLKYAPATRVTELARSANLESGAAALVELVTLPSGSVQDDVAVVLCRSCAAAS